MSGNRYSQSVKDKVDRLRKEGKTYAEIRKIYPIPKSTLSVWLGEKYAGIFDKEAQYEHLKKIRILAVTRIREDKIVRDTVHTARGTAAAQSLPVQDKGFQKALLAMLYWAEGTKHEKAAALTFSNTDPRLVVLYLSMLRNCFDIDEKRLRVRLHLHYYHNKRETRQYWSKLLDVPENQFGKLYVKKRSKTRKFRRNFKGICIVFYGSTGLLIEMLALGQAICDRVVSANPPARNRT